MAKLGAFEDLWAQSAQAGSTDLYVDVNRTDTYVADGTPDRPYRDFNVAVGVANAGASAAAPYRVLFGPGIVDAAPCTVAPYVKLQGAGWLTTTLRATDLTAHFLTLEGAAVLRDACVWGPTSAGKAGVRVTAASASPVGLSEVAFSRGHYGILCDPAAGAAHELRVQFRVGAGGGTAGCQDARIEVWRVA